MLHRLLTKSELTALMQELPSWKLTGNQLVREFKFDDFKQAFAFMTKVAAEADRINHHPNWTNEYNRVTIQLWTHENGGITDHDVELAQAINKVSQ